MINRLGEVLYWVGCGGAAAVIGISIAVESDAPRPISASAWIAICVTAFLIWLCGRALRYVLSGR